MAGRHVFSTFKLGGKALQQIKRWPEQQVADEKEQKKKREKGEKKAMAGRL